MAKNWQLMRVAYLICRLKHLESSQDAIGSELDQMKMLGSSIEGWKHQMNDAGAQAAAVLALVQSDGSDIRYGRSPCLWMLQLALCLCL